LVASIPWATTGLKDMVTAVVGGIGPPRGVRHHLRRWVPEVRRGRNGSLWFHRHERVASFYNGSTSPFPVAAAEVEQLTDIAPMPDGGLIVLGVASPQTNVLARLGPDGLLRWRRTGKISVNQLDLPALKGEFGCLLQDQDAAVYLPDTRIAGEIGRVDPDTGETRTTIRFANSEPMDEPILGWGRLFGPPPEKGPSSPAAPALGVAITRNLRTGAETRVPAPVLGELFATVVAGLPDGGRLVLLVDKDELVWSGPDGASWLRLAIAGAAPTEDGLAVATRDGDDIVLSHWRDGKIDHWVRAHRPGSPSWLEYAGRDGYYFTARDILAQPVHGLFYDVNGQREPEGDLINDPERLVAMSSAIDMTHPAVEPDGSIIIAGANAAGVFMVRVRPGKD
jgi:hypothetical protein